ncbi:MAG: DTW domain-containing protein [Deltaproteobacteria bacterium]|nr:DTW domain-containing protein [Deltaproteobacteria bacterium]
MTEPCEKCGKPKDVCVCERVVPQAVKTRIVILQHPQEQDVVLGTAPLLEAAVGATRKVGLSWPNLAAVAPEATGRWAVAWPLSLPKALEGMVSSVPVLAVDRRGGPVPMGLEGVILLDGTWSQAKTLWWRNAWLLRLDRLLIRPKEPSIYGRVRREPRKEMISTLETAAETLTANGEDPGVATHLRALMRAMVQRARDAAPSA